MASCHESQQVGVPGLDVAGRSLLGRHTVICGHRLSSFVDCTPFEGSRDGRHQFAPPHL